MKTFGSLTDSILARHGIGKQVLAAQVVRKAQEKLVALIPPEFQRDMKILSFKDKEVTIACQNPTARYEADTVAPQVARLLEEDFPQLSIICVAKLRPEAFMDI
ncbi:MAG: hypothetical protein WC813_02075 [Patescibacteria group bacterium]|jgi:hypothetical protein